MRHILFIALSMAFWSCNPGESNETAAPIEGAAVAFDKVLGWDEIREIVPDQSSPEDSARLAESYINEWLKEQVLLHTAQNELPPEAQQFEDELEAYRKTLLTYAFENSFVQQRLDTTISETELNTYYNDNPEIFTLNDYIVKVKFCISESSIPKERKFKNLFESQESIDLVKLEQFCVDYGIQYYLDIEKWMFFEELLEKVPLDFYNIESFLKKNKSISFEKGGKQYYLHILEYKLKDSVSPLDLVEGEIKNLILSKRKKQLLQSMREELFKDAHSKGEVKKMYE